MKTLAIAVMMVTVSMVTASPFLITLTSLASEKCQGANSTACANEAEECGRSIFMNAQQSSDALLTLEEIRELREAYFNCAYSLGFANQGDVPPPNVMSFTAAEKEQAMECAAKTLGKFNSFVLCVNGNHTVQSL